MEGERTSKPLIRTQSHELAATISPDGNWIAYASNESGRFVVYVRPFPDVEREKSQISRAGGRVPIWAPDGHELFYRDGDVMMVPQVETEPNVTVGVPEVTGRHSRYASVGRVGRQYDIHPGGGS